MLTNTSLKKIYIIYLKKKKSRNITFYCYPVYIDNKNRNITITIYL